MTTIFIILILILLAAWNGLVIQWQRYKVRYVHSGNPLHAYTATKYSKWWHAIGWIWRLVLYLFVLYLFQDIVIISLLFINLSWTIYDVIINLIIKNNFFYIDNKGMNKIMIKIFSRTGVWIFRLILIIINIVLWLAF